MFCLSSDFDLPPYSLPDLNENNSFQSYVDMTEEKILKKLLGKTFYDELIAGLAAAGSAWSSTDTYGVGDIVYVGNNVYTSLQAANENHLVTDDTWWELTSENDKWLILKNGSDYTYSDENYEWVGLKAMLKPYIVSYWTRDVIADTLTSNSVVQSEVENGTVVSPSVRISKMFNEFSKLSGNGRCVENSLYGFLFVYEELYPDAHENFKSQGRMNSFNL